MEFANYLKTLNKETVLQMLFEQCEDLAKEHSIRYCEEYLKNLFEERLSLLETDELAELYVRKNLVINLIKTSYEYEWSKEILTPKRMLLKYIVSQFVYLYEKHNKRECRDMIRDSFKWRFARYTTDSIKKVLNDRDHLLSFVKQYK